MISFKGIFPLTRMFPLAVMLNVRFENVAAV